MRSRVLYGMALMTALASLLLSVFPAGGKATEGGRGRRSVAGGRRMLHRGPGADPLGYRSGGRDVVR